MNLQKYAGEDVNAKPDVLQKKIRRKVRGEAIDRGARGL
jgi:hypothetical protein